MANRLYYCLFALAHARLISLGLEPRALLGTWDHTMLPILARRHLEQRHSSQLASALRTARFLRETADYRPTWTCDGVALLGLMRLAEALAGEER